MSDFYGDGARHFQDRFDTRRLADRIEARLVQDHVDEDAKGFIERMDMFFLATVDARGRPSCSYKGGAPGFVRVLDPKTIAFPSQNGNGMYVSMGNVREAAEVGLLFIDFIGQSRMRLGGTATIDEKDELLPTFPEAELVVRVKVREVFPNCPRYVHKMTLVERSRFVPAQGGATPVPAWKKSEWACDVLPVGDPATDEGRVVLRR
jgi:predicted pyridoxine 5'-phosphate oxidase superfamily flavin-nucleotide-binding protein